MAWDSQRDYKRIHCRTSTNASGRPRSYLPDTCVTTAPPPRDNCGLCRFPFGNASSFRQKAHAAEQRQCRITSFWNEQPLRSAHNRPQKTFGQAFRPWILDGSSFRRCTQKMICNCFKVIRTKHPTSMNSKEEQPPTACTPNGSQML